MSSTSADDLSPSSSINNENLTSAENDNIVLSDNVKESQASFVGNEAGNGGNDENTDSFNPTDPADMISTDVDQESETGDDDDSMSVVKDETNKISVTDPTELIMKAVTHKETGNDHFRSGKLDLACRSYRQGTSLLKKINKDNTGDEQVKALLLSLQTNLSMMFLKQNKPRQSRDVATKALSVDSTNVKALYRRAAANRKLGDVEAARCDLREALTHDPDNREVKRELLSIKKEMDLQKNKKKKALSKAFSAKAGSSFLYNDIDEQERREAKRKDLERKYENDALSKRKVDWENECVQLLSKGEKVESFEEWEKARKKRLKDEADADQKRRNEEEARKRKERKESTKNDIANDDSDTDEDELTEQELKMCRGYKKTSDGRTTSYFSREQTTEEKMILGNIAPQRISTNSSFSDGTENASSQPMSVSNSRGSAVGGSLTGSAWNQAGTWEERNTTEWCTKSLSNYLNETSVSTKTHVGKVLKVQDLEGDASVAFVSGKTRYVFDYHCKLSYEIKCEGTDDVIATGHFELPDISSTAMSDELEVRVMVWEQSPKVGFEEKCAIDCRNTIVEKVRSQVIAFVNDFNEQH